MPELNCKVLPLSARQVSLMHLEQGLVVMHLGVVNVDNVDDRNGDAKARSMERITVLVRSLGVRRLASQYTALQCAQTRNAY